MSNPPTRPVDHTDAATYQPSDYSGVTTADLVEILHALNAVPATMQVSAVSGRVRAALDRRRSYPDQVGEAHAAHNARMRALLGDVAGRAEL